MTSPEVITDFSEAIELIERDERTEGGTAPYLGGAALRVSELMTGSSGSIPNLTMSPLVGYVPAGRQTLDEPAV